MSLIPKEPNWRYFMKSNIVLDFRMKANKWNRRLVTNRSLLNVEGKPCFLDKVTISPSTIHVSCTLLVKRDSITSNLVRLGESLRIMDRLGLKGSGDLNLYA